MALTWQKAPLRLFGLSNSFLSLVEREIPEGASQTFVTHSPIKIASGLAVEWTSGTDIAFWSCGSGQNTTGAKGMFYFATPDIGIEANFLGAAAADNVLAAADFGITRDIAKGNLLGAANDAWYIQDSADGVMVKICQFHTETKVPNELPSLRPAAGDTNARLRALPLISKLDWYD